MGGGGVLVIPENARISQATPLQDKIIRPAFGGNDGPTETNSTKTICGRSVTIEAAETNLHFRQLVAWAPAQAANCSTTDAFATLLQEQDPT